MGYPTAYRSGARKYGNGGFQNPLTVPPGKKPPRTANDNWPKPANDNDPGAGAIKLPEFPAFPGLPAEDLAMRYAVKLIPPPLRTAINFLMSYRRIGRICAKSRYSNCLDGYRAAAL